MKILIVGGTNFVGRHITARAIQRGHDVSLLNRCNNTDIFPQIKRYCEDRNYDIGAKIHTDCVIDVSGYYRHQIKNILNNVYTNCYAFVSTSVVGLGSFKGQTPFEDYVNGKIECEDEIRERVKNYIIFRIT